MSARTALADALQAALPSWRVLGFAADLDAVTRPTVMVWQQLVEHLGQVALDRVKITLEVWVLTGLEDPRRADAALDEALDDVLTALQPLTWVDWSTAERGVLYEKFHGYRLTCVAVGQIGA